MDHYATQMSQSSIPGPSQDEPQAQLQHAELVPFDMYADPSQYAPPGPAPTAYGMETAVFDADMLPYGLPPLMPDMMGHVDVPSFEAHFPQSQMAPGAYYDPSIPLSFELYFPQPQMAPGPLYDPSIPLRFEAYDPQPQMLPEPSHHPSAPLPMGVYLPQPSYGHPSPPSTIQSLNDLLLEPEPVQEGRVLRKRKAVNSVGAGRKTLTKRKAVNTVGAGRKTLTKRKAVHSVGAGRKTRTRRPPLNYAAPPNFKRAVKRGKVEYKCLLPQCKHTDPMQKGSLLKHIGSKTHSGRTGQHVCQYCGKESCSKGPSDEDSSEESED
ncbi:hypothetical protein DEU56DRAFT_759812 [Suillus clintonianus]|uniref:uncharacterized protein n=1 Tax=Suillus clintonianus TaxID=1904413 RepID=UPI001B8868FF|nr:uncharacterized protein DEU56DRAFT_759812 [Suillus clintonianus]KAG2124028.1 hypothetical protein DEU56DRAFT_759812 [Suillus clintonianus]